MDFYPSHQVAGPFPSLLQILNGQKPANSAPVRLGFVPGTKWQYSGAGYLVAQQLMIDAAGQQFPEAMRSDVFTKIGMTDTTYEQPLPLTRWPVA